MSVTRKEIAKAFHNIGRLKALLWSLRFDVSDPATVSAFFDEAIEELVIFLQQVSEENKDAD